MTSMKHLAKYMSKKKLIDEHESGHASADNYPSHLLDDDDDILPGNGKGREVVEEHGNTKHGGEHYPSHLFDDDDDDLSFNSGGGEKRLRGKGGY